MSKQVERSNGRGKAWWAAAVVLLIGGIAWAFSGDRVDPEVAALESQRKQVFSDDATDADRAAFREQVRALSDDQRRQFFERSRPDMQARLSERMNALFTLPPEQMRQEARARAADVVAARNERPDRPDGGPPGGPTTEAQRDQRRKQRLDMVDAGTRGQLSEFRRMVDAELQAMGQEPLTGRDMRALVGGGRGGRGV